MRRISHAWRLAIALCILFPPSSLRAGDGAAPGANEAPPRGLLIVAPDRFHEALASYVEHKERQLPTRLLSLEEVLRTSDGADDPERLKRGLHARWKDGGNWGYVLLVGDADVLPVRYMVLDRVTEPAFDYAFYPSDLYYADLVKADGGFEDWNASREGFHAAYHGEVRGEKNKADPINYDAIHYLPEVAVGRWPVSSADEVRRIADKTMAHEGGLIRGSRSGPPRAGLLAVGGWVDCRRFFDGLAAALPGGWQAEKLYYRDGNKAWETPPPDAARAVALLNGGVDLVLHAGHGQDDAWEQSLSVRDIEKLRNDDRLPVVLSAGCSTARFATLPPYEPYVDVDGVAHTGTYAGEVFKAPPPPPAPYQSGRFNPTGLGEQLVRRGPTGAVAYIGCNTGSQPCALTLLEGFVRGLGEEPAPRLGDCWSHAIRHYHRKERLESLVPNADWYPPSIYFQGMKFMLFGDPSLLLQVPPTGRSLRVDGAAPPGRPGALPDVAAHPARASSAAAGLSAEAPSSGEGGRPASASFRWDLERLSKVPAVHPAPGFEAPGVRSLFYEGLPWKGKPTRVFAWYGVPEVGAAKDDATGNGVAKGSRYPAMVLVHGGGGTAFAEWVRLWTSRGYAALAMDLCGSTPGEGQGGRPRHESGGPPGWGGFDQVDEAAEDQWTYHAVADAILGHSLLRSFPEVDPDRIGVTGISWGGYLTCIISAVDSRFRFAAPVYGCGFLGDDSCWVDTFRDMGEEKSRKWLDLWDPSRYLSASRMPMLWVTGTNDFAYPMSSLQRSYRLPAGARTLCVRVRMPHAHGGPGENPEEIHAFANAVLRGSPRLVRITEQGQTAAQAWAKYEAEVPVVRAELNYTRERGPWQGRSWLTVPGRLDAANSRAVADVPADASAWYINLVDERGLVVSTEHAERAPVNFVLFLLDDMRWDALGCAGHPIIRTPAIDGIAAGGVLFSNTFCTTSICAVSRATILTGQYASRHGIHDFATPLSAEQLARTFSGILRRSGYRTGFIGKWGVGETLPRSEYDYFEGFPGQGSYFAQGRGHLTDHQGLQALEFLDGCGREKPFCLQVSFKAPHIQDGAPRPFQPAPRFESLYDGVTVPVPRTATDAAFAALPEFLRTSEGRVRWRTCHATPDLDQRSVKDYFRLIVGVDEVIGKILDKLSEKQLLDSTVVIFTSDNGFFLGEHGLSGKWFPHEESIRLPLLIRDPRLPAERRGSRVDAVALTVDIAPTILDLAGLKAPESVQGSSLRPLLHGEPVEWRKEWFYEHRFEHPLIAKSEGVRGERWKYFRFYGLDPTVEKGDRAGAGIREQLFDLHEDPGEERDLSRDPAHASTLEEMRRKCDGWREKVR